MDVKNLYPPPQRLSSGRQETIWSILREEMSDTTVPGRPRRTSRHRRMALALSAATATAVAVTLAVTVPGGRPSDLHPAAAPSAGSRILLAAATSVAHQTPGRYWHVVINGTGVDIPGSAGAYGNVDQWVAHDGTFWTTPPCKQGLTGKVVMRMGGSVYESFGLGSKNWTWSLVQHWPASVAGLQAKIASYTRDKTEQLSALTALELLVPTPAAVRAAAYRAIAAFPGVQDQGPVQGGQALFIPARDGGPLHLVIDPATGLIRSQRWPEASGQMSWVVLSAQWVNQLPKVIPSDKYYCSARD